MANGRPCDKGIEANHDCRGQAERSMTEAAAHYVRTERNVTSNEVAELTHVSGPAIIRETRFDERGDLGRPFHLGDEVGCDATARTAPVGAAQRWQLDTSHGEAMKRSSERPSGSPLCRGSRRVAASTRTSTRIVF